MSGQFLRYLLVGLVNTTVTLVAIYLALLLEAHGLLANAIGYGAGLVVSYTGNRIFTFKSEGEIGREAVGFVVVFGVSYAAAFVVLVALLSFAMPYWPATLVSMGTYTVSSFALNRGLVFASPSRQLQQ